MYHAQRARGRVLQAAIATSGLRPHKSMPPLVPWLCSRTACHKHAHASVSAAQAAWGTQLTPAAPRPLQ
jgi:hypothetical protein